MKYTTEELRGLVGRELKLKDCPWILKLIHVIDHNWIVLRNGENSPYCCDGRIFDCEILPEIPTGFTRHLGGECPVDGNTVVDIVDQYGEEWSGPKHQDKARMINWSNITAYRIVEQEEPKDTLDIGEWWQVVVWGTKDCFYLVGNFYRNKNEALELLQHYKPVHKQVGIKQVNSNVVEVVR